MFPVSTAIDYLESVTPTGGFDKPDRLVSTERLSHLFGIPHTTMGRIRARDGDVDWEAADRFATGFGFHPSQLWGWDAWVKDVDMEGAA